MCLHGKLESQPVIISKSEYAPHSTAHVRIVHVGVPLLAAPHAGNNLWLDNQKDQLIFVQPTDVGWVVSFVLDEICQKVRKQRLVVWLYNKER